jgi:hypothetical protein
MAKIATAGYADCTMRVARCAVNVAPEDVAETVPVEVGDTGHRPIGGDIANAHGRSHRHPVHEPYRGVAGGIAPKKVVLAIAIEVALTDDRPGAGHPPDAARRHHRRPIHQPQGKIATIVAPTDVALTVVVEVVSAGQHLRWHTPDVVALLLREPQRPARADRDAKGLAIAGGCRVFGDDTRGRDPADLANNILQKPQCAVRTIRP